MLEWRVTLAILLIVVLSVCLGIEAWLPPPGLALLALGSVLAAGCCHELTDLLGAVATQTSRSGLAHVARAKGWVLALGLALMILATFSGHWLANAALPLEQVWTAPALAFGAWLVLACSEAVFTYEGSPEIVSRLGWHVLGVCYLGWPLCFLAEHRWLGASGIADGRAGLTALVVLILVVKLGDTGAYTVGRLVGKRKLAPVLSPGKTVEGALGGLAFSCVGAWLGLEILAPWLSPQVAWSVPVWAWLGYGIAVGLAGMLGDLLESLIKRAGSRKDSSHWLPGFGGVLDVLDSLLLAAPVSYLFWLHSGLLP